ncbi:cysteine desulfurase family protein [Minwuia sp.]|uniref:cysteine desulfurase family protein n=1 Tax=Minwuia sp. TaxID=2493630 RepID=UPI003A8CBAA2
MQAKTPPIRHYLDCNATAPLRPEAKAAMRDAMDITGNASSVHAEGRTARALVDASRRQVADLMKVRPSTVHFTASGTEANNWALSAVAGGKLVAATSHDSTLNADNEIIGLPVDGNGLVDMHELSRLITNRNATLVSVMAVNNETGVIQPLEEISAICRRHDVLLHVDAVQAPGKIDPESIAALADLISLSAHKLGGPAGCGALLVMGALDPDPLIRGGGQEQRRRAGTENLIGIAGFGAAAEAVSQEGRSERSRLSELRDRLESALCARDKDAEVFGQDVSRAPNTTCIRMPGVAAETQVMALDLAGVSVSAGSACSSGKVTASHVLLAMGVGRRAAGEAIRISLGWNTTDADVDACIDAWTALWRRKRAA